MNNSSNRSRGSVSVLVAICMFALIGFLGLAIDFGYAYVQKNRAQNVADAEALACVINPTDNPCPVSGGDVYPEVNTYSFAPVVITNPGDNSLCLLPASQKLCAKAEVTAVWDTFFLRLFNVPQLTVNAVAIAGRIGGEQGCLITPSYFNVSGSQGVLGTSCANYFGSVAVNGNPPIVGTSNYIYNGNSPASCTTCQPPAISMSGPLVPPGLNETPTSPTLPGTSIGFTGSAATTLTCPKKTTCQLGPGLYHSVNCSNAQSVCNLVPSGSTPSGYTFAFSGDFTGPGNNGSVTGNKVLVMMTGVGGHLNLSGGGTITLSSPSLTGGICSETVTPESQIVIYSPVEGAISYNGNVASNIIGNIYMPGYAFSLGGNGGLNVEGTVVVNGYSDGGGGNSGLQVNGGNSCGFGLPGGRVVLVD